MAPAKLSSYLLGSIFALCLFMITGYSMAGGSDWRKYAEDVPGCPRFYDADSIGRHGDHVKVWTKYSDYEYSACEKRAWTSIARVSNLILQGELLFPYLFVQDGVRVT